MEHADQDLAPTSAFATSGTAFVPGASGLGADVLAEPGHRPPIVSLDEILTVVIEGYLFGDLASIRSKTTLERLGSCGYPIVMSILTGCELLGALTTDDNSRIEHYWRRYMARINPKYDHLAKIAVTVCRHGIAHRFLTYAGVEVTRDAPDGHLRRERDTLVFDCLELDTDFRRSYEEHAKPEIENDRSNSQRRLNGLVQHDFAKADHDPQPFAGVVPAPHITGPSDQPELNGRGLSAASGAVCRSARRAGFAIRLSRLCAICLRVSSRRRSSLGLS